MTILLSPGPVYVPEDVLEAQDREMITHRSREFTELYTDLCTRTKNYLNAEEAYFLTGSGTLGIEACVLNCCRPEEKALSLSNGEFGDRLAETVSMYTNLEKRDLEAGKGWDLERARAHIDETDAQVFAMVYNETGYGVRNHAREIYQHAKKKGMLTIMDSVSAWPSLPLDMKEFGVDFFITGSQKAIGAPPGSAVIGLSAEAVERIEGMKRVPAVYCDLRKHRKRYAKSGQTPNTPAVTVFWAIQKCYGKMDEVGGVAGWVERHRAISEKVRGRISGMGLELIPEPGYESYSLTAFRHSNAAEVKKRMLDEHDVKIVGCKGAFRENGLRIAHMGCFSEENIEKGLEALEKVLE